MTTSTFDPTLTQAMIALCANIKGVVATALAFAVPALGLTACDDKGSADLICRTDRTYEVSNFGYFNQTGLPIGAVIAVNNKDPKNPRASNPITLDPSTFTTSTGSQSSMGVSWTSAMAVKFDGNTQELYDGLTEDAKLSVMSAFKSLFTVDVKGAQRVNMTDVFAAANANSSLVSALQSAPPTMEYFLVYAVIQADSYDLVLQNEATAKGSGSKYVVNSKDLGLDSSSGSLDITVDADCEGRFKANGDGFDAFIKLQPLAWSAASSTITINPDAQVDWSRIDMSQAR
jgi:hypothetical protein